MEAVRMYELSIIFCELNTTSLRYLAPLDTSSMQGARPPGAGLGE